MKPSSLRSDIFLDSGNPRETKEALSMLGFLDGQTTNPTLISKNPSLAEYLEGGRKLSEKEALSFYRRTAEEIHAIIPEGSISLEVYADDATTAEEMIRQGRELASWLPAPHVKLPTTREGIRAGKELLKEGVALNMTLCFSQEQAASLMKAFGDIPEGRVYVSPFVGRLDDRGENGMDLVRNILAMYRQHECRIRVLTASVRHCSHLLSAISLGSHIVTCPMKVLKEWKERGADIPGEEFRYERGALSEIPNREIDLSLPWERIYKTHPLTEAGLKRFSDDWNSFIE